MELGWWWPVVYVALAVVGLVSQLRAADRLTASMRQAWEAQPAR